MYPRKRRTEFTINDLKKHLARNIASLGRERDKLDKLISEANHLRGAVQLALNHLETARDMLSTAR